MDIRLVNRFLTVVESGSFNKAAQRLNLSQPALAKSIESLEYSLGVSLLDRTPRGVSLTPYGKLTYDHARRIASEVRRLEREIDAVRTLAFAEISVGVPLGQTSGSLAFAVLRLLGGNRRINLNIVTGARNGLVRLLLLGDLDFLFTSLFQPDEIPAGVAQRKLYEDPTIFVVRCNHPVLSPQKCVMADLMRYSWIALSTGRDAEVALRTLLGKDFQHSQIRSGSPIFVKNILLGSDLIGLVQRDTVSTELAGKQLVELKPRGAVQLVRLFPPQDIGVIYRSDVSTSEAGKQLIAEMDRIMSNRNALTGR